MDHTRVLVKYEIYKDFCFSSLQYTSQFCSFDPTFVTSHFATPIRDVARFSNPGGQAVMWRAYFAPRVGIGLIGTPNSRWAKANPAHLLTASLPMESSLA